MAIKKTTHFNKTIYQNILKLKPILGIKKTLKYIGISYQQYHQLKQPRNCKLSVFKQCLIQHPNQLHQQEVDIIEQYCTNPKYQFWKLISIFHQIRRDRTAFFSLRTFYKYANAAGFRRQKIPTQRKNHTIGIRAGKPLEILHVDTTILRLLDHSKAFIHLIQDNFSRAILGVIVSQKCLAQNTFDNITQVYEKHLKDKIDFNPIIITDDGSENKGEFKEFTQKALDPLLIHKIAQSIHFHFSNSMIENANKQLKYCFLYHQKIEDFEHLLPFVQKAIEDFNNRPHGVLNGFTPMEVLNGQLPLKIDYSEQLAIAKANRIALNRKIKACCVI
ncbi:MAG: transposase [Bacteroidetes bacterium]|nr:transposase [Bacteroidota bacterium]